MKDQKLVKFLERSACFLYQSAAQKKNSCKSLCTTLSRASRARLLQRGGLDEAAVKEAAEQVRKSQALRSVLQRVLALSKREEDAKWANANKRPTLFGAVGGGDEAPAPPARKPPPPKKASPKAGGKRASSPGPAPAAKAGRKGDADARSTASGGSGGGGGKARGSSRKRAPTDADAALERTAYLGVEYNSSSGKYRATIRGRTGYDYCLGWYASATEAAACYDETARGLHGPGAETNFAPSPERRDLPLFDLSLPKSGKTASREEPRAEEKPRPLAWYEETVAAFLANERQKGVDV